MYRMHCDWCGDSIDTSREQYVRARIEVMTGKKDYAGREETETEPTRFFHMEPLRTRDEWDRLGLQLEVRVPVGDCCYTRMLRAIEPVADGEPADAGLEWRLMPVAGENEGQQAALACPEDLVRLWRLCEDKVWYRKEPAFKALNGLLCPGMTCPRDYEHRHIDTVGDLRRAVADGSLRRVRGIGPKKLQEIKEALPPLLAALAATQEVC